MNYINFEAGNETYKLRLNTRAVIELEKKLGCNPLSIFGKGDTIPTITIMVYVLHAALQPLQHNLKLENAYDIFDRYLEDGHTMMDFLPVMIDLFKASGLLTTEDNEKNV